MPYRPAGTIVGWLVAMFIVNILLNVLDAALGTMVDLWFPNLFIQEELSSPVELLMALGVMAVGLLGVPIQIALVVLFCVWIYRAHTNVDALGASGLEFTPGWCVGWFFIPIANLFKPSQAVREIFIASDPELDDTTRRYGMAPWNLKLWWGAWIAHNVVANIYLRISWSSSPQDSAQAVWIGVTSNVLNITASSLAISVVYSIHRHQQEKARRQSLSTASEGKDASGGTFLRYSIDGKAQ